MVKSIPASNTVRVETVSETVRMLVHAEQIQIEWYMDGS